mmetsp:Transcript_5681/g.11830  ORF Transcript_5681/g.11830 Transcript_5681/m.11830 type:complete len:237 (-) Transcript_5681:274-984(-)
MTTFSAGFSSSFLASFLDFLSFLASFLDFLESFLSSLESFLDAFSADTKSSAALNESISSKAHKISNTSASLAETDPCRKSHTAKCNILIMRLIFPLTVSHEASCSALSVLRLDNFCKSRSKSRLIFSAALFSLMDSAVVFLDEAPPFLLPPPFFLAGGSGLAAAAASSSAWSALRFFSSSHFLAGSKILPSGGAMSRRINGTEDRLFSVTMAFRESLSKVLAIPSRYINAFFSTQ